MKRKTYITPHVQVVKTEYLQLLSSSGVTSNNGIGFGGFDDGGAIDPASRELQGLLGLPGFVLE